MQKQFIVNAMLTLDLNLFNLKAEVFSHRFWSELKRCQWAVETYWGSSGEEV